MTIGMSWFPDRKGMAMGIVVGGFGGGAFLFNQVQTAILNPDNVQAGEDGYFVDEALLERVPSLMLILAAIYFSIQMLACALIREPPMLYLKDDESDPALKDASAAAITAETTTTVTHTTAEKEDVEAEAATTESISSATRRSHILDDENNVSPRYVHT